MPDRPTMYGWVKRWPGEMDRRVRFSTPDGGEVWVDAVGGSDTVSPFHPSVAVRCVGVVVAYLGDNGNPVDDMRGFRRS